MRFLLEKSLLSREQEIKYNALPENKRLEFVNKFIRNLPNYSEIVPSVGIIASSISKDGFDTDKNKFLDYITNVKWDLDDSTASIVSQLIDNGKLDIDVNSDWVYNPSLYKGTAEEVNYKLKAFAYASNKDIQKGASKELTTSMLLDDKGNVKDTASISDILKSITIDNEEKVVPTGMSLLKSELGVEDKLDFKSIINYVSSLYDNADKGKVINVLNTPQGKDIVRKVLGASYKDDDMYDDLGPMDLVNDAFRIQLDNILGKSKKDMTGADILRSELDSYNYSDIVDYVLSVTDGRYRTRISKYLNSAEGKDALDSLLNKKDYFDNNLGDDITPLDKLNNAIKVMVNKAVVVPADKDRTTKATKAKKRRAQQKKEAEKKLNSTQQAAVEVLKGSKLSEKTATALVKELYKSGMSVEDLVLSAFKNLGK